MGELWWLGDIQEVRLAHLVISPGLHLYKSEYFGFEKYLKNWIPVCGNDFCQRKAGARVLALLPRGAGDLPAPFPALKPPCYRSN